MASSTEAEWEGDAHEKNEEVVHDAQQGDGPSGPVTCLDPDRLWR
jgi:hypothetical protein